MFILGKRYKFESAKGRHAWAQMWNFHCLQLWRQCSPPQDWCNTHRVFQPKKLTWVSVFRVFIETYWLIGWTGGQADTMWSKGLTIYNTPITPEIPGFKGYLPGARDKGQTSLWARPNSLLYTFITYLSIALQIKSKECFIILSRQPHLWITEHLLNPTSTAVETTLQLF